MVQESEGTAIVVVPDPAEVQDLARGEVALQYCPQGVWVCFDDCKVAPLAGKLESNIDPSAREALRRLIALRPSSTKGPDDKINNAHGRLAFVPAVTRAFSRMIVGGKWTIQRRQVDVHGSCKLTWTVSASGQK